MNTSDNVVPPSLRLILGLKETLRKNSGKDIPELTTAPTEIRQSDVRVEDSGLAVILEINPDRDSENGMFFRVHSWDTKREHELIRAFIGKRVEVTIKVVPDAP